MKLTLAVAFCLAPTLAAFHIYAGGAVQNKSTAVQNNSWGDTWVPAPTEAPRTPASALFQFFHTPIIVLGTLSAVMLVMLIAICLRPQYFLALPGGGSVRKNKILVEPENSTTASTSASFLDGLAKVHHASLIKYEKVTCASRVIRCLDCLVQPTAYVVQLIKFIPIVGAFLGDALELYGGFFDKLSRLGIQCAFGLERPFVFLIESKESNVDTNVDTFLVADARLWWQKFFQPADLDIFSNGRLVFSIRHVQDVRIGCGGCGNTKKLFAYTKYTELRNAEGEIVAVIPITNIKQGFVCCSMPTRRCLRGKCVRCCSNTRFLAKNCSRSWCTDQPLSAQPTPTEDLIATCCCDGSYKFPPRPPLPSVMTRNITDILPPEEGRFFSQHGFEHPAATNAEIETSVPNETVTLMNPAKWTNCYNILCGRQTMTSLRPYSTMGATPQLMKWEPSNRAGIMQVAKNCFRSCVGELSAEVAPMVRKEMMGTIAGLTPSSVIDFMSQRKQRCGMAEFASVSAPVAKKLAIMLLKPKLAPYLRKLELEWADVVPMLELVDGTGELQAAVDDPQSFLEKLASASAPVAKKLAIMLLKPKLAPYLRKLELEWADAVPMLELVDGTGELQAAVDDPQSFLEKLASASAPVAKKLAIMLLKPKLAPYLRKLELEWADAVPMLELVDGTGELQAAVDDPQSFLEKLASASAPVAKKLAIMLLKPKLAPYLRKLELEWADAVPMLELVDGTGELQAAVDDPQSFLEKLASASAPVAKKLAIMLLKPKLAPYLRKLELEWADAVPMLELVDGTGELQAAVDDPQSFLEKLASASTLGPSPGEGATEDKAENMKSSVRGLLQTTQIVRTNIQCECIFPNHFSPMQKLMTIAWLLQEKSPRSWLG